MADQTPPSGGIPPQDWHTHGKLSHAHPGGGQPHTHKRSHKLRNAFLIGAAGVIALIVILAVSLSGTSSHNVTGTGATAPASPAAPAAQPSPSASASGPQQLSAGQAATITNSDSGVTADVTVGSVNVTTAPQTSFGESPQNGTYVYVTVTVNNVKGNGFDVNPLDFYVVENGTHYDQGNGNASSALDAGSELNATTVNQGEQTSGPLAFDVPAGHGQVVYAPNINGAPLDQWSF